jgi:hypothetical protein
MNTVWISAIVGIGFVIAMFARGSRPRGKEDMGAVSTQWLAEYRQSHEL